VETKMMVPFLDLKAQYEAIKDELWPAIREVIERTQFILGPAVERFEQNFASYCGAKFCVATGSGTDSLHLALLAAGIGPGDEVITQANTFVATLEAISYCGAKPVLVDVAPPSYAIDTNQVCRAITSRTKAIVPVHLFGQPCDLEAIYGLAEKHNLVVIEDASQAHGAEYHGRRIGSHGIASFSFYPGKNLGGYGEGGGVTCNDARFADRMRRLRNHGSSAKYLHPEIGYNYRMDGIQGAVLDVKLRYLNDWTSARRRIAALYDDLLSVVPKPTVPQYLKHVYHIYPIFVPDRDVLRAKLAEFGVETNVHYPVPCHLQQSYQYLGYSKGSFPYSEHIADSELSLPLYAEMSDEMVRYVTDLIKRYYSST